MNLKKREKKGKGMFVLCCFIPIEIKILLNPDLVI